MRKLLILAAAVCLGSAVPALAQSDFEWTGQLAPGQRIAIHDVNGSIRASAARDGNIVVTAVRRPGRKGSPSDVRIETVAHAGGVTVCVVYKSGECQANGIRGSNNGDNDTSVDFTVQVPAGILLRASTVNGSIDANGLQSDTEATTVNGSVTVATSGSARATTVNGAIQAAMGRVPNGGTFTTVNGDVTLQLPAATNANVRISTVSGDVRSDFPLQIDAEPGPKNARGTIGAGGQELAITTVNGGVTLVRR
jgi:DUF4097 and DUF4098 domain-containing protein YvlB